MTNQTSQTIASNQALVENFKRMYQNFGALTLDELNKVYTQDIEFKDPVHNLKSIFQLKQYFEHSSANLLSCDFSYDSDVIGENNAYLTWNMTITHKKINNSQPVTVRGMTEIRFTQKIFYHEDSYDVGAMVYQHIPLIGGLIKRINKRICNQ
jgi:hypothetical protein